MNKINRIYGALYKNVVFSVQIGINADVFKKYIY